MATLLATGVVLQHLCASARSRGTGGHGAWATQVVKSYRTQRNTNRQVIIWLWLSKPMGSHFGVGAPPSLVDFGGDSDAHWGYGIVTHGHMIQIYGSLVL